MPYLDGMNPTTIEILAAVLFACAVVHTFSTRWFEHLARTRSGHSGLWHLLGEVEIVFGLWAGLLVIGMTVLSSWGEVAAYLESRQFVEPIFVFAIMVVAASRPVLQLASDFVARVARRLPLESGLATYFVSLSVVPLLGSLITEPAAMTLAALMLRDRLFGRAVSKRTKYLTLGVLFVNISIGGTLTNFAAPPVLMVAGTWGWSTGHMFAQFGWKAAVAVFVNAAAATYLCRRQLAGGSIQAARAGAPRVPAALVAVHVALLAGIVLANHRPVVLMGVFLLFLGLAEAYKRYHGRLILREGLMVAFFLAGLIVLGGQQKWWLQTLLTSLDESTVFFGAALLTAVTDNAALTYLGSLVDTLSAGFQYALVAGAVAGGGLTVIANAPNPAGFAILKGSFEDRAINPLGLAAAALPPTAVALLLFGVRGGPLDDLFVPSAWGDWLATVDRPFLFLVLLPLIVVAFGLWADRLERARRRPAYPEASSGRPSARWSPAASATGGEAPGEGDDPERTRPETAA